MPTSVRLDPATESLVSGLARKTRRTKSQVIRDAIQLLARSDASRARTRTFYEDIAHLVGCASGGPPDLSERTGDKLRKLLQERRRP